MSNLSARHGRERVAFTTARLTLVQVPRRKRRTRAGKHGESRMHLATQFSLGVCNSGK